MPHGSSAPNVANPLTAEVTRGGIVESWHRGSAVIVDPSGQVLESWGEIERPVYPRSAVKAFQALPVLESGAANAAGFEGAALAILCGSHGGEPSHIAVIDSMLAHLGLGPDDLECGTQWPSDPASARALAAGGEVPDQRHNPCSGKHAGMLALARHLGVPEVGYTEPDHPVQSRVRTAMSQMMAIDLAAVQPGTDGCAAPTWPVPLDRLACGFARLAAPKGLDATRAAACRRLASAAAAHPFMISGTGRFCTAMMERIGYRAFIKSGAEGVFCAGVRDSGIGIALKCDDGAERGGRIMLAALLRHVGAIDDADARALSAFMAPTVENRRSTTVGEVRTAPGWPEPEDGHPGGTFRTARMQKKEGNRD